MEQTPYVFVLNSVIPDNPDNSKILLEFLWYLRYN